MPAQQRVDASTVLDADVLTVYEVISDLRSYPEWTDFSAPDSVVTGERLNYNLTTGEAKIDGACKGRKCGKGRRVAILIRNSDSAQGVN